MHMQSFLEELYEMHAKTVYWAAYSVSRDSESAKDAVQNVFLSALRHTETLKNLGAEQQHAWLYRAGVNSSIDMLRRNKRSIPVEDAGYMEADPAYGPQTLLERSETSTEVQKAVAALPKKYREPIMLYYFAELDYKKIAALLQMNEGTLKSRMSRGRELIKKQLQKGGGLYA